MFCIVLADRPYGSCKHSVCKRTFLKPGVRVEKSKNAALVFSCGRRICILCITPSSHHSTSSLQPLNPATSHNNNNNGGLHACEPFLQLTRIVVECELHQQYDLINSPRKRFWFPCTSHFCLLLVVFGFSVLVGGALGVGCPETVYCWSFLKHWICMKQLCWKWFGVLMQSEFRSVTDCLCSLSWHNWY